MEHDAQSTESEQAEIDQLLAAAILPLTPGSSRLQAIATRLDQRIAESAIAHAGLLTMRAKAGNWQAAKDGVRFKTLWEGSEEIGQSVLVEFAAGAFLPVHRHHWLEEGIVLHGGLQMGALELEPFAYHASPAGSRHARIQSRQGGLAFLRGTSLGDIPNMFGEILSGLLPYQGGTAITIHHSDQGWQTIIPGVLVKELYQSGTVGSYFYKLLANTSVIINYEECMMLEGELFLADILLMAGDYQAAAGNGSRSGEATTDVGALFFVRGSSPFKIA